MPPTSTSFMAIRALSRLPSIASRARPNSFTPRALRFSQPAAFITPLSKRHNSSQTPLIQPPNSSEISHKPNKPHAPKRSPQPGYDMTFTCTPCSTRSTHRVSKQGYHHGSVLITCPECKNRHVISDHLNIFGDKHMTIEDLMRERGQLVKKGTLSEDGNLEFWEDGSTTKRGESQQQGPSEQ